jgi:hypothetical protein
MRLNVYAVFWAAGGWRVVPCGQRLPGRIGLQRGHQPRTKVGPPDSRLLQCHICGFFTTLSPV